MSDYTASAARLGLGTLVELGQNDAAPLASPPTPETFLSVGEVTDVAKSGAKSDTPDVTNHQSPDGFREFISGLKEAGEVQVSGNWVDPSISPPDNFITQEVVEALFNSGERRNWKIVVPPAAGEMDSPGYFSFKAIVNSFGDSNFGTDKQINYSFKLKISGKYTYVAA